MERRGCHRFGGCDVSYGGAGGSYELPANHFKADGVVVRTVLQLLREDESGARRAAPLSVLDLGAGVGQYGAALRELDVWFCRSASRGISTAGCTRRHAACVHGASQGMSRDSRWVPPASL